MKIWNILLVILLLAGFQVAPMEEQMDSADGHFLSSYKIDKNVQVTKNLTRTSVQGKLTNKDKFKDMHALPSFLAFQKQPLVIQDFKESEFFRDASFNLLPSMYQSNYLI
ncbi:hypothetical protein LC085_14815 [Bacillus tianshenii]|uniref:hypothetical protein n=1 Tax=Sutcliffiella tianshenii TaxID=1463404 RepID=UPI0019577F98|nr:hypothetical protein [Bacillus tianshenii]MCA1321191.1 hypothetical protein [Bacillus tianshenii]